jgi:hypothetical protein
VGSRKVERVIAKCLQGLTSEQDMGNRVRLARALQEAASDLERQVVSDARAAGVTWTEIGRVYDTTKQAAQQRFRAG